MGRNAPNRRPAFIRIYRFIAVLLSLTFLPLQSVDGAIAARSAGPAANSSGDIIVGVHDPRKNPADFLVTDPNTGELCPYVIFDESTSAGTRLRVRIRAATVVGYQDFIFDAPSNSVSIEAADEIILRKFQVLSDESPNGRGWVRSQAKQVSINLVRHDNYAEVTLTNNIGFAGQIVSTFKLGFDGDNYINTVESRFEPNKVNGQAFGLQRRAWFAMQGLPVAVPDKQITPTSVTPSDDDRPVELSYGNLNLRWLGPGNGPFGQQMNASNEIDLRPSVDGILNTPMTNVGGLLPNATYMVNGATTSANTSQTIGVMNIGATTTSSTVTVTSPGKFELVFDASVGGGISAWYDLLNDPGRTQNLVYSNNDLFDNRIMVGGNWYYTSISGQVELVSADETKAVVRQSGTFTRGSSSLVGTTYQITYTVWNSGQVGVAVHTATSATVAVDREDRELQVNSSSAWTAIDDGQVVTASDYNHQFSDYVGFESTTGPFLDPILVQNGDWANAHLIFYQSLSAGSRLAWRATSSTTWNAGTAQDTTYLLLVGNSDFNSYSSPEPYSADYRNPQVSVRVGTSNGFDPAGAAYRLQASSNETAFTLGQGYARYQPRFIISNWSASTWRLSYNGTDLVQGTDYTQSTDLQSGTVSIQYLGVQTVGAAAEFRVYVPGGGGGGGGGGTIAVITSLTPPDEIGITDEGGTFVIPYIQQSTSLNLTAQATGVPSGGGIEFVLDSTSTYDLSAPYAQTVIAAPGNHRLDAYVVDSSMNRQPNPEAHMTRQEIGIGKIWDTIGDSITAGMFGDSSPTAIEACAQSPSSSLDCRNYFQHNASDGVWYRGYQVTANDCLAEATGSAQFLMNDGYGGITAKKILDRMSVYTDRIQQLGVSGVMLLDGTNDANNGISSDQWKLNIEAIIGHLKDAGVPAQNIYLGYVPYRKGTSSNADAARQRMQAYNALVPTIAADTGVSIGPDFYTYFENHLDQFANNLHPNRTGYDAMGGLWTQSITGSNDCSPGGGGATHDVEVTSISTPTPVVDGVATTVTVHVQNQGSSDESGLALTLKDGNTSLSASQGTPDPSAFTLTAGAGQDLQFDWTPSGSVDHTLSATVSNTDNTFNKQTTVTVDPVNHQFTVTNVQVQTQPANLNVANNVTAHIDNSGNVPESLTVSLTDANATVGSDQPVNLNPGESTDVTISWTPTSNGLHTVVISASNGSANTSGQTQIDVGQQAHDVAIDSVSVPSAATQGQQVTVSVAVRNPGSFSETDFTVSLSGAPGLPTAKNVTLNSGASTAVDFIWDTSSASANTGYTVTATAVLPGTETDAVPENNSATSGTITIEAQQSNGCPTGQFLADYYANKTLSGSPALSQCETSINYDWGNGGPGNGVGTDNFSVRWDGQFDFSAGNTTFTATTDDGIRVYLDGTLLIDQWRKQGATTYSATVPVTAGTHEVKVEYYEQTGGAVAQVSWATQVTVSSCTTGQFLADYYANKTLSGSPAFSQCETSINYDWGNGGPGNGVGTDNFSVRWDGQFDFSAGNTTFTATTDDGIRVYLDGTLLIDQWRKQGATTYSATVPVTAGTHEVKVEYYEQTGGAVAQVSWATQ